MRKVRAYVNKKHVTFKSIREMEAFSKTTDNPVDYMTLYMRLKHNWSPTQALRVPVNPYSRRFVLKEERHTAA
jgi:hypothetical protein